MSYDFYDELAPHYHLIFEDWPASIARQGEQLDAIVRIEWGTRVRRVLDAAAGIGTQTLGLLAHGYDVTASDLSAVAVRRARDEVLARGFRIETAVADLRSLSKVHGTFDLVIACDNAIPHLLTDDEILRAFRECFRCTVPGGGMLISVRDYVAATQPAREGSVPIRPTGTREMKPYGVRVVGEKQCAMFQVWTWDGPCYDLAMYIVEDDGGATCSTRVMRSRYYAVSVARLIELAQEAGFERVRRIDGAYYQPIVVGTRPDGARSG